MRAASADDGVIALFQLRDEAVAARGVSGGLHLRVRGAQPAHADILADGIVKEIVVLRDERRLLVELRERNLLKIVSAHGDRAAFYIPEARRQLGQRRFAGAGGADQRGHAVLRNGKIHTVQDFQIVVIPQTSREAACRSNPFSFRICCHFKKAPPSRKPPCLCYARDKKQLPAFREIQQTDWATTNADSDPRGNWFSGSISFTEKRSNPNHKNYYSIVSPSGKVWTRQWQTDEAHMKELIADNRIFWGQPPAYDKVPRLKIFNEEESEVIPRNIIEPKETTRAAQHHLDELLGQSGAFDNPKPVSLIKHLIEITRQPKDALILDFFAGSGTTFEAVCALNAQDKGKRRSILVQKDENGIFELCKKRCQKVSELFEQSAALQIEPLFISFTH